MQRRRWYVVIGLLFSVLFLAASGRKVDAKGENYILSASAKSIRGSKSSLYFRYTKITFRGNQVTLKGNIYKIPNGKGKAQTIKKVKLPLSPKCKFYDDDGDGGLSPANRKKKIKAYQKLDFYALFVTVKNGEVVRFADGRYD